MLNIKIFDRYYLDVMVYDEIEKFGDYYIGDKWKFTYPYQNRTTLVDSHSLDLTLDNKDDNYSFINQKIDFRLS